MQMSRNFGLQNSERDSGMSLKNITTIQWMGIIILFNTILIGGASQLADLALSPAVIKAILAIATLGNGFLGGLTTMFGGQGNMVTSVASFTGEDGKPAVRVGVNANAGSTLAAVAVDPAQPNVGAASPEVREILKATAKSAA
jgi:hypothetical protein